MENTKKKKYKKNKENGFFVFGFIVKNMKKNQIQLKFNTFKIT